MRKVLEGIFAEHASPAHASKRHVHDQMADILSLSAAVQKQVVEYHAALDRATTMEHDPAVDTKIEHFRQTFGACDREARAFAEAGRNLVRCFAQLDRYIAEAKESIDRVEANTVVAPATPATPSAG